MTLKKIPSIGVTYNVNPRQDAGSTNFRQNESTPVKATGLPARSPCSDTQPDSVPTELNDGPPTSPIYIVLIANERELWGTGVVWRAVHRAPLAPTKHYGRTRQFLL